MKTELRNYGASSTIDFVLYALDGIKFATSITFATGDIKLSLDGGAEVNSTNLPVLVGQGYSLTLTAAEQTAARISVKISDQTATQVWLDTAIEIETYGNALAQHEVFPSNIVQITGATLPAQNLALQYNGTGLIGDNFPAPQAQVANITPGAGGLSTLATGITITTGSENGTSYTDTFALDGAHNTLLDDGGVTDFYYTSSVGTTGVATSILWEGYIQSNNDTVNVFGWNWISSQWEGIGSLIGSNTINPFSDSFTVPISHTGTGANDGDVRIRFESSQSDIIATDRLLFVYTAITQQSGLLHAGQAQDGTDNTITLDDGASAIDGFYVHAKTILTYGTGAEQENMITDYNGETKVATVKFSWKTIPNNTTGVDVISAQAHCATASGGYDNNTVYIDILGGSAGAQIGVNGTIDNPSNNMTDARAIADATEVNANKFEFVKSTSGVVLDQDYPSSIFTGRNPIAIDLGERDVSLSSFVTVVVSGTCTNTTGVSVYDLCGIANFTCGVSNFLNCGLIDTLTLNQSGAYYTSTAMFSNKFDLSDPTPEIVFNSDGITGIGFEGTNHSGTYIIKGMKAVDVLEIYGNCKIEIDASCVGGTFIYAGDVDVSGAGLGNLTIIESIIKNTNNKVSALPTTAELEARTLLAAEYGTATNQASIENKIDIIEADVNAIGIVTTDTNVKVTSIGGDYSKFDPDIDVVANVALVDVTTENTDMKGTDNALLASSYVAPDNATIGIIDAKVDAIGVITSALPSASDIDTELSSTHGAGSWEGGGGGSSDWTSGERNQIRDALGVDGSKTTATSGQLQGKLNTSSYTAPDNATIGVIDAKVDALGVSVGDIPNTAAFEARTLPSADYFDFSSDEVTINAASVNSVFAGGSIDSYSLDESLRLILAASAAKLSGAATTNILIRDTGDTKNRIDATVDPDGNRTVVVLDAS